MKATVRIVREHDGRFAARNEEHPKLVGRGATEDAARRDFEKQLADLIRQEVAGVSDYEDWSGRGSEDWRD